MSIPAGNYDVTALELDWGDAVVLAEDRAVRDASKLGATLENWIGPLTGMVALVLIAVLPVLVLAPVFGNWELLWTIGPWYVAVVAVLALVWNRGPFARVTAAREAARDSFPTEVLVMRRLADTEDVSA